MLGGYGIVGGHIPLAAGRRLRVSKYRERRARHPLLLRRGRGQHRRLPRGAEPGGAVEAPDRLHLREQRVLDGHAALALDVRGGRVDQGARLRHGARPLLRRRRARGASGGSAKRSSARASSSLPTLVEVRTYRFRGHSMSDPAKYRTPAELEERQEARSAASRPLGAARARPTPRSRLDAAREVGRKRSDGRGEVRGREPGAGACRARADDLRRSLRVLRRRPMAHTLRYREALREAMIEEMERDDRVFLMGEEVGHYQGAYKVSEGMLDKFGPKRVIDTPIAEARLRRGRHRRGDGRPAADHRVHDVELQRGRVRPDPQQRREAPADVGRAVRLSHRVPRARTRAPGRSAASTATRWSTSTRTIPGLKVVAPAFPADAKGLLKSAIRDDNPVLVMESETLYAVKGEVPDGEHIVPLGKAQIVRPGHRRDDRRVLAHDARGARGGGGAREGRHLGRGGRPPLAAPARRGRRSSTASNARTALRRRPRGLALRRRRRRDRRPRAAPRVRRARRAGPARDDARRAHAVQREARAALHAAAGAGRRDRASACSRAR